MAARCNSYHAPPHLGQQQIGQGEVAEVIDAELEFEAVGGAPLRRHHHARVVDQQIDR